MKLNELMSLLKTAESAADIDSKRKEIGELIPVVMFFECLSPCLDIIPFEKIAAFFNENM